MSEPTTPADRLRAIIEAMRSEKPRYKSHDLGYVDSVSAARVDDFADEPEALLPEFPQVPRYTADQLAQQRQHCAEMQAFLRRKGTATSDLRDATTYAEIAAVIDAYLEALEQLQGGGR